MAAHRHSTSVSSIPRNRAALAGQVGATLVLGLLGGPHAASAASPNGSQFQVNTYTTSSQSYSSVAMDSAGNFVVVWASQGSAGSDSSDQSVQGQRYAANGSPLGGEFQVNTYTGFYQRLPSVASDPAGNFVVVWNSAGSAGSDTSYSSVQGQRYNASGSPIGAEFQVNTYSTGTQILSSVAMDSAGNFVVVWGSGGSAGSDTYLDSVQGQRYAANGSPIGGQFQVNTYTTKNQRSPAVVSDSAGSFVVVWQSNGSAGSDTDVDSVQGQRYAANGSPIGGQFQVNTYTTGGQRSPEVASDSAGNFVVVWQSQGSAGSDTAAFSYSVQGQRFDASGSPIGGQFQVNTYTAYHQTRPSVASDAAGNFVVVWGSGGSAGGDTSAGSVQGQHYDATGSPIGGQFQVNSYTTAYQGRPSVASDSGGNFVVIWDSSGSAGGDTSNSSVQGQRYLPSESVDLTCCPAGSINGNQSFNGETRAADVTVLSANAQPIGSISAASVDIRDSSALVGARIYDSNSQALIASANLTVGVGENQRITVPISATLAAGGTYRIALFVPSTASSNTGDSFDPSPPSAGGFPYVESLGLFQVNAGYQTIGDSFPATSSIAVPWGIALPEPGAAVSLLAGAALVFGLRVGRASHSTRRA